MPAKGKGAKSPNVRRLAPGQKTPCILHLDSLSGGWVVGAAGWAPFAAAVDG